jgi:hypothetical protein
LSAAITTSILWRLEYEKIVIAALVFFFFAGVAQAGSGCEAKAVSKDGKLLAGAAKAVSIKKCEADAKK